MNDSSLKKGKISKIYSFILITLFFVAFQSCSKNDESADINETMSTNAEYLDADVSNLPSLTEQQPVTLKKADLSEEQNKILKKARARIDGYIVYQPAKKMYRLKVSSGSQIQMSERLFEFFKAKMNITNTLIQNLDVIVDSKDHMRLHVVKKSDLQSIVRLKSANVEGEDPPQNTDAFNLRWDGIDFCISTSTLNLWAAQNAGTAILCAWIPEPLVSKISATVFGLAGVGYAYLAAENPTGLRITINW